MLNLTKMTTASTEKFILAYESLESNAVVKAFIEDQVKTPGTFNVKISANDDSLGHILNAYKGDLNRSLLEYFLSGQEIMNRVREIVNWRFHGFENVSSFLDFACGSGRLTRFLIQELPVERINVCDIQADAVKFQENTFGVKGIVSVKVPEKLPIDSKYDMILASSLFSHLPQRTFTPWLQKLTSLLNTNGVLIFSVNDEAMLHSGWVMPKSGIFFAEISENKAIKLQDYGTTWVNESFVKHAIDESTQGKGSYYRLKKGLWEQDLYVLVNAPDWDFSGLKLGSIKGCLDHCFYKVPNRIILDGWTVDTKPNSGIAAIEIMINNELVKTCIPDLQRPDVAKFLQDKKYLISGWSCEITLPESSVLCTDMLMVKVITKDGSNRVAHLSSIGAALSFEEGEEVASSESTNSPNLSAILQAKMQERSLFETLVLPARNVVHHYRQWRAKRK